jgi:hypothetical protein
LSSHLRLGHPSGLFPLSLPRVLVSPSIPIAFSATRLYSVGDRVKSERWIGKDLVANGRGLILRYYPCIRLEVLRETTKHLSQHSLSPGPRFEPETSLIGSRNVKHSTKTFVIFSSFLLLPRC